VSDGGRDDTADAEASTMTGHVIGVPPRVAPSRAAGAGTAGSDDASRYELRDELARGGGGRVCKAFDRKLGREVAIKFPHDDEEGAILRARLEREARILAGLEHPAIVPIHDAGRWTDGRPYFAMRLLGGNTLRDALRAAKTFDARVALLAVVVAIADAMAYAHRNGVIHRDLKPQNVVVGELGDTVVIDWGLAKRTVDDPPFPAAAAPAGMLADGTLTQTGAIMGTPAYMAPEQALGQEATTATDVFSIGVILYELLAGARPHDAGNQADLSRQIVAGPTKRLEEREPRVRRELAAIVEKAMALTPADRYRDAGELAADLARYQGGRLVVAHRYTRVALAGRWIRRHAVAISIGVGVVAVAGVTAFALTRSTAPSREAACRAAALPAQERWNSKVAAAMKAAFHATGAPDADATFDRVRPRLDAQTGAIGAMRIQACTAHARGEQSDAVLDQRMACLDRRLAQLDAALGVLAAPDATVVMRAEELVGRFNGAADCADLEVLSAVAPMPTDPAERATIFELQKRLEQLMFAMDAGTITDIAPAEALLAQIRVAGYAPLTARALQRTANEHADRGDAALAERELRESVLLAESSGADRTRLGSEITLFARLSRDRTRDAESLEWMRQAFALAERIHAPEEHAALWGRKGEFQMERGHFDDAVESGRQALEILTAMPKPPPDKLGFAHYMLSNALLYSRKYEDALVELDKAEASYREAYGDHSTHEGTLLNARGTTQMVLGRFADAAATYQRSLAFEERVAPSGPGMLTALVNLGNAQYMGDDNAAAIATFTRGRDLTAKVLGKERTEYASFLRWLGEAHANSGELDTGLAELRESVAIYGRLVGDADPEAISAQIRIGEAYRMHDRFDEAIPEFKRALLLMGKNEDPHAERGWALTGLGDCLSMAHHAREAIVVLEQAIPYSEEERDDQAVSTSKFALARSLAELGRDLPRAVKLAHEARALLVPLGDAAAKSIANIDEFLAVYDPPPKPPSP
jgi:tetratricopeptide (TPR) repeat protein